MAWNGRTDTTSVTSCQLYDQWIGTGIQKYNGKILYKKKKCFTYNIPI